MSWGAVKKPAYSGLCLTQLSGLTAEDTGTDRARRLTGWGGVGFCSQFSCLSISWTLAGFWVQSGVE